MGQSALAPTAGPGPVQQPPVKQYPPTRVQGLDRYGEQPDPFPASDAYADQYRDPEPYPAHEREPYPARTRDPEPYPAHEREPYPARAREPERHRDDPYDDRYRERDRDYNERRYADRDRDRGDRFHRPSADAIGRTVQVLTALIALVFVLHVVFVVAKANQSNGFVAFTYGTAKIFVLGLGDVFTPNDATIGVILNYGLAALIYLFAGRIIARALTR